MKRFHSALAGFFLVGLSAVWAVERMSVDSVPPEIEGVQLGMGMAITDGILTKLPDLCVEGTPVRQRFLYPPVTYQLDFAPDADRVGGAVLKISVSVLRSRLTLDRPRLTPSATHWRDFSKTCGTKYVSAFETGGKMVLEFRYSGLSQSHLARGITLKATGNRNEVDRFEEGLENFLSDLSVEPSALEYSGFPLPPDSDRGLRAEAGAIMKTLNRYVKWVKTNDVTEVLMNYEFADYSRVNGYQAFTRMPETRLSFR